MSERRHTAVGLRCDASRTTGVGHLVRCVALAEELVSRGVEVRVLGRVDDVPWAVAQLRDRGLPIEPAPDDPAGLAALATARALDAVVLDGYELAPGTGAALRAAGVTVLALQDGGFGAGQEADVYLDQNLGAAEPGDLPPGSVFLAGLDHLLLRDLVRGRRPAGPRTARVHEPLEVLTVFGGTDAQGAAEHVVPLVLATGLPVRVTAVAARADAQELLAALPAAPGQHVHVTPPVDDLPALAVESDLVVTAAGTSLWEMLCLGLPTALVAVTDNQEFGYVTAGMRGVAVPAGRLGELVSSAAAREEAVLALHDVLTDPAAREGLSARGLRFVDGCGRERVADTLLALAGAGRDVP